MLLPSLYKLTALDTALTSNLYLPLLLKLLCKVVKVLSKATLLSNSCHEELFRQMLQSNMNHQNPEVRKNVVFCLVEVRSTVGDYEFRDTFDKLPQSQ